MAMAPPASIDEVAHADSPTAGLDLAPHPGHDVVVFASMRGQLEKGIGHQPEPLSPRRRRSEPAGETVTQPRYDLIDADDPAGELVAGHAEDALYAERRDRSILFWKSMPASDLVTIASKAIMPVLVIPGIAFAIALSVRRQNICFASAGFPPGASTTFLPPRFRIEIGTRTVMVRPSLWIFGFAITQPPLPV